MASMVPNKVLEVAKSDPSILTPEEVKAMAQEIMYNRKFIGEKMRYLSFKAEVETLKASNGITYWVVLTNGRGETLTPYNTPNMENALSEAKTYNKFFSKGQLHVSGI